MHAQTYLVFRQMLTTGELHPQMQAATDVIWGERLPRSGYALAVAPDFQIIRPTSQSKRAAGSNTTYPSRPDAPIAHTVKGVC